ncbi:unnamed protein product [Somion occarium]|uniref:DUF6699 domain-containing protein n=1 Tax=Somion occarium TaxID=3059160 RepID=A0ABP1CW35_9APHY
MWDSGAPGYHNNCHFLDSHWDSPATEEALTEIAIICEKLPWTIAVSGQKKGQSGRHPVTVRDVLLQLQENLQQVVNIHEHEALQEIRSGYYDSVYRRIDVLIGENMFCGLEQTGMGRFSQSAYGIVPVYALITCCP